MHASMGSYQKLLQLQQELPSNALGEFPHLVVLFECIFSL